MFARFVVFIIDTYFRWTAFIRDRRDSVDVQVLRREIEDLKRALLEKDRQIEQHESTAALHVNEIRMQAELLERERQRVAWETANFTRLTANAQNDPRYGYGG